MSAALRRMALAVMLVVQPFTAKAEFMDGNLLLSRLQSSSSVQLAIGLGYVQGVADAREGVTSCLPSSVTVGQVSDLTQQWLISNPAERHRMGDVLVAYVLKSAWPCANKPKGGKGGDV